MNLSHMMHTDVVQKGRLAPNVSPGMSCQQGTPGNYLPQHIDPGCMLLVLPHESAKDHPRFPVSPEEKASL